MIKLYLPLLEIFVACSMIYLIPEGLYKAAKRIFGPPSDRLEFVASNVRGFMVGSAITLCFLFTFGVSYEDFAAKTVRNTASEIRRIVGFDPVDRCISRAKEVFRFTPNQFKSEAISHGLFPDDGSTYTTREELLVEGYSLLATGQFRSVEDFFNDAHREFCQSQLERGLGDF